MGQADVAADGANLDDEFFTFLEQPNFTFGSEGGLEADFVAAVALAKGVGPFGAGKSGWVLPIWKHDLGQGPDLVQAENFLGEKRDAPGRDRGEIIFDFLERKGLGAAPFAEERVVEIIRQDAIDEHLVDRQAVDGKVNKGALGFAND